MLWRGGSKSCFLVLFIHQVRSIFRFPVWGFASRNKGIEIFLKLKFLPWNEPSGTFLWIDIISMGGGWIYHRSHAVQKNNQVWKIIGEVWHYCKPIKGGPRHGSPRVLSTNGLRYAIMQVIVLNLNCLMQYSEEKIKKM